MGRFIIRRLLLTIPLLVGVSFITFALVNLIPGSPVPNTRDNPKIRPADVARLEKQLGLDKPWPERYVLWLGDLLRGDLGRSMHNQVPVRDRIWAVLPNTLLLSASALVFALMIAIPLGVYAAARHRTWFDRLTNVSNVALFAIPNAWLAIMLVVVFTFKFKEWGFPSLPATGITDTRGGGDLADRAKHLLLPMVSLSLVQIGVWASYIRSSMLEVLQQDYIRTARAKGVSRRATLYGHAFRNALLPLVTLVGLSLPGIFGGAVLIEYVFAWNGIGLLTLNSVTQRDYTMVMGTTLMFSVLTILGNLFADVAYAVLDPRIRLE
ncbi:MAG TPA: ABC transporter permease [Thermomicrobiales bacterium]|nr:ABC transporter permease [Thermomicrobiales bacterium]